MAFAPGAPALTKPRALELRAVQERFDIVRQRLLAIDTELTRLGQVADASNVANTVAQLQASVRQLLIRITSLESALGLADTFSLAAGEVVNAYDCIVPVGVASCGPADPNDPTHIHALLGVAQAAAAVGQSVTIQRRGSITVPGAAFTTGRPCYVGLDAQITQDASGSAYAIPIGVATSSATVWIAPSLAVLNQVDTYTSDFDGQLPVTYDYLQSQIGTLESLLNLADGFVYLYQGTLVTTGSGPGGGVTSVNGQTGDVELYLGSLLDVIVDSAVDGDTIVRRSGTWVAEAPSGGGFTASSSAPGSPAEGDRWFDLDTGILYTYVNDGDSSQWVEL